ncbi:translation initiation factor IF-2-like [Phodopus roborovskii]|uniref:translation initiation factor IF-2-like n=1 Tax=Phodopus roborovskii TaxID=109678 RepID=UPI0021E48E05|nr:translation initiation factor IF-2-like [Phodopus roborovskii]
MVVRTFNLNIHEAELKESPTRQLSRSSASALPSPPPRLQTDPQEPSPHLGGRGGWETQAETPAAEPMATRAATPRAGPSRRTPARPTAARRAGSPTAVPAQPTREGRRGAHGRRGMRAARGARGRLRAGETRRAAPKPALDAGPRRLPGGASPLFAKKRPGTLGRTDNPRFKSHDENPGTLIQSAEKAKGDSHNGPMTEGLFISCSAVHVKPNRRAGLWRCSPSFVL